MGAMSSDMDIRMQVIKKNPVETIKSRAQMQQENKKIKNLERLVPQDSGTSMETRSISFVPMQTRIRPTSDFLSISDGVMVNPIDSIDRGSIDIRSAIAILLAIVIFAHDTNNLSVLIDNGASLVCFA